MPAMGTRKGFILTIAMGALGAGCGPEQHAQHQEAAGAPVLSRIQQRSISDWFILGIQVGTQKDDEFLDVILGDRGNVYVSGYEAGLNGTSNVEPASDSRGLIIRYDAYLDEESELRTSIDTRGTTDVIEALAFHPTSHELFFAGRTTGAYRSFQNQGQFDSIVGWLDSGGAPQVFQWGTEKPQHPRRLAFDSSGDLIVGGYDDIYIPSNYVESVEDPFVSKLRWNKGVMEHLWTRQFNTGYVDLLPGLALDDSGGIYVTGTNSAGASRGMFVRKLDTLNNGSDLWNARQSTIGFDSAAALSLVGPSSSRSLIFAGSTFSLLGERQFGGQDVVVRKLSMSGTTQWTHQYGTDGNDWVTDMATDANGNIYLVGETTGSFDSLHPNQGGADIFVLKLDPSGLESSVLQMGSSGDDHPSAVTTDACGIVYVAGYTTNSLLGGEHQGGRDAFVVRLTPPGTICSMAQP